MNKTLILVRGIPGSGKTTLSNRLCSYYSDTDEIHNYYLREHFFNTLKGIKDKKIKDLFYIKNDSFTNNKDIIVFRNSVAADDFMIDNKGNYCFNKFNLGFCHEMCRSYTEYLMANSDNLFKVGWIFIKGGNVLKEIYVNNTFITSKETKPYYELADRYNWNVQEIICKSNFKNVHNVPEEKIEQMRNKFEY